MTASISCPICGNAVLAGGQLCAGCGHDVSAEQALVATAKVGERISASKLLESSMLAELWQATLGEYAITGELGRGGMAIVYQARDIALDRPVAIKVISPALLEDAEMVERFLREARTSAALSHPHIIPVYAVKQTEQLLFFVMKMVAGRSLDSIVEEVGALDIKLVQAILTQVGSALGYAHRNGVIHRDVKPANIKIDEEGFAVVTDFGIAKAHNAPGLTQTGLVVGTPTYMAPEQFAGKEVTGASDQYALGVSLYQMITGKAPFTGTVSEVLKMQLLDDPARIDDARPECPAPLSDAVHRMLAKDPADRFPTIEEAVSAVGAVTLSSDDPVRSRMIALAKVGVERQRKARVSAPISPSLSQLARISGREEPASGSRTEVSQRARRRSVRRTTAAAAAISLFAGGGWAYLEFGREYLEGLVRPTVVEGGTDGAGAAANDSTPPSDELASAGREETVAPPPVTAPPTPVVSAPATNDTMAGAEESATFVPPVAETGVLQVRLLTWAEVTVDGVAHGRQSRVFVDTLSADVPHLVRFSREGFVPVDTTIVVTAGGREVLEIRLEPVPEVP